MNNIPVICLVSILILFSASVKSSSMLYKPAEVNDSCFNLEFLETWNLGTFTANNWLTEGENWNINGNNGNPAPAAEFTWDPIQADYEIALESYQICATDMTEGKIWLDYDIRLDSYQSTGEELMHVQVWNWESQSWTTVADYSNANGSFDWTSEHINIRAQAMNKVFKVRFLAIGSNSINIVGWFIDNIDIYRTCEGPTNLTATATDEGIVLDWTWPGEGEIDEWIHWDSGVNSGNSFGTGEAVLFDVAARWEPAQLTIYGGSSLTEVAFFPAEAQCTYRIRVWIGSGAANMVVDQPISTPVIGQWNYVTLDTPVPIDSTQELWVGYNVDTQTGYPAGADDGPAIDGYGNMINFSGWQTLLQFNPNLNYNWNIAAHLQHSENSSRYLAGINLYRSINGSEYELIDYLTGGVVYTEPDSGLVSGDLYCFMVSAVWESETDWCASDFSNEACVLWGESVNDPDGNADNFNLYPNPANDHVYIKSSSVIKKITIQDLAGQVIINQNFNDDKIDLNLSGLTPGEYIVLIKTKEGIVYRKLVVLR